MEGLTTYNALKSLTEDLKSTLESHHSTSWTFSRWKALLHKSILNTKQETSLFPWPSIALTILNILVLGGNGIQMKNVWLIVESTLLFVLLITNIFVNIYDQYLTEVEMLRKLQNVVLKLERHLANGVYWSQENYPHLHTPLSASVVLQWTIRDGHKVNLPWALLVKDDLIYLKPGQTVPGRCHSVQDPTVIVNKGEILHLQTETGTHHSQDYVSPIPEFKPPVEPQLFRLDETPYMSIAQDLLDRHLLDRPTSRLTKYQHLFFVQILTQFLGPIFLLLIFICNLVQYFNGWHDDNTSWNDLLILTPIVVALPMVSLSFPMYWIIANYVALAKVMNDYLSFRHVHVTDDPFDDAPCNQQPNLILEKATEAQDVSSLKASFISAIMGRGEYMSRTENLLHTLGSVTALCCTDKKGILSWPNTSPEKVFILKSQKTLNPKIATAADVTSTKSDFVTSPTTETAKNTTTEIPHHTTGASADIVNTQVVPEVLTISHDHKNPFKVDFDDISWKNYVEHLKPIGLSIMLNTCNLSTEEKYTNFFNHLVCESMRLEQERNGKVRGEDMEEDPDDVNVNAGGDFPNPHSNRNHHGGGIELLPIVTRGCLCELAKTIGFDAKQVDKEYSFTNQIQTFRHIRRSSTDAGSNSKFIRNLHLAKLKFPFPHMVSVLMHQNSAAKSHHLISQGTADIILDSCIDVWTGHDLEALSEDVRRKILDFYQRASLSSYCTAFSYRPLLLGFPWSSIGEYLQLPSHSLPFYSSCAEQSTNCADADAVQTGTGHISLGTYSNRQNNQQKEQENSVKTTDDALTCLELECNQTFLGMVQLQYQPWVDMVQLIGLLEKACIRFVHFSKENELRSRVFSEKMGLESGWNCHISLRSSEGAMMKKTVSYCCPAGKVGKKKSGKRAAIPARLITNWKTNFGSLPDKLDRHPWFLDFPRWHDARRGFNSTQLKNEEVMSGDYQASGRQDSATSDSSNSFFIDTNRAQLPRGIRQIRPHLENMDNVPLLVSLFTDCDSSNTREMIVIMQDYGEVVCVLGSSANHANVSVFLQADASLAIEPLYPQVCQHVPVFQAPSNHPCPSPTGLSQILISVASSLTFHMEDEVSIFHLILESRHFSLCLLNAMQFWVSSLIFVTLTQVICQFLWFLPLFLSPGQTLWLILIVIPMLSMSLLGPRTPDSDVMNISTGKNQAVVDINTIRYAIWCYGFRFLPTIAFLILGHGLATELENNHLNLIWVEIYLMAISLSFLFRARHLWQRHPGHNRVWLWTILVLVIFQIIYSIFEVCISESFLVPPTSTWITWSCGVPLVIGFNEAVKRYEIKGEVRYQKRQRLEFGTKLGINSPF